MTIFLSADDVVALIDAEVSTVLLDRGKLDAATARPRSGFGPRLLFPTVWEQAAALLHGIVGAHAFVDGNKRAAWISTVVFLELNGQRITGLSQEEMADFVEEVALGARQVPDIARWFSEHASGEGCRGPRLD